MHITHENADLDLLIARYLGGTATTDEVGKFEDWIRESQENRIYFDQVRNIWESSYESRLSPENALSSIFGKQEKPPRRKSIQYIWQKIAAVLIIPLILGTIWLLINRTKQTVPESGYQTISSVFGTVTTVQLPDGSQVWLNSGSVLKFPRIFNSNSRQVELTGEAFFKVQADKSSPFIVRTNYFDVEATGTQFNVLAFKDAEYPSIVLSEGKLQVDLKQQDGKPGKSVYMLPDQHLTVNRMNAEYSLVYVDVYKYYAWKDGKMVFRNDPLSEVAYRMSLQYNADVLIKGNDIRKFRYRATFQNESLGEVLELLKLSSPIGYKVIGQKIQADGTYSRKKVILFGLQPAGSNK